MARHAEIELRVLGDVHIAGRTEPLTRLQKLLLGSLILRRGGLSVDSLMDILWPEAPPKNPRSALQIHVSRLRRQLTGTTAALKSTSIGYELIVPDERVDVREFERLAAAGMALTDSAAGEGAALLDEAFAHWKGRPFGALTAPVPLHLDLLSLEELRVNALEASVIAQAGDGRIGDATVTELRQESSRYPLNERLAYLLMLALFDLGRDRQALETYARVQEDLRRELGVAPGPDLEDLREKILTDRRQANGGAPSRPLTAGFVGRKGELAAIDRALDLSDEGTGTLAVVTGEFGIGKSALVDEAVLRARTRGHHVLIGRCADHEGTRAEALLGVLRSLETDNPFPLEPLHTSSIDRTRELLKGARGRAPELAELNAEIEALIRDLVARRPVLIVIEDVHVADGVTFDVLDFLARRMTRMSIVFLISARMPSIATAPGFDGRIFALSRIPGAQRLALEGLQIPEAAECLTELMGSRPTKHETKRAVRRTRGNPLFIKALAQAGELNSSSEPPPALKALFRKSVVALPLHSRRLVLLTAFMRGPANPHVLAAALGVGLKKVQDALGTAVAAGILDGDRSQAGVRIRHPLLAETMVIETPPEECRRIHRDLAWVFSSRTIPGITDSHAAAAHHWTQAGDPARGVREYLLAADEAAGSAQSTLALSYMENAIDLCAQIDDDDFLAGLSTADLRVRAAEYAMLAGHASRATEHARAALAAEDTTDPVAYGRRWLTLADALRHSAGPSAETSNAIGRALDLIPDAISEARVRALLGQIANWSADPDHTAQLGDQAIEFSELIGSPDLLAHALVATGCAEMVRGHDIGASMALHGRNIAEQSGSRVGVLTAYASLARAHILCGRPDEGANVALAGLARIPDHRQEESLYAALAEQAITGCTLAGRWNEIGPLRTTLDGNGVFHDAVTAAHAHFWAIKGDSMRAKRTLRRLPETNRPMTTMGWLDFYQGRGRQPHRAEERILERAPYRAAAEQNEMVFLAIAAMAKAARTGHVSEAARAKTESLLALLRADPGGMPTASAWASLARAEATALGSGSVEGMWRDAEAAWNTLTGWPHIRVYLQCRLAIALGRGKEATELLASAMALARKLESTTLQEFTVGAAVQNKIAPDTLDLLEVQELTPRERDVLEFVVDGASNNRIATALELSEKTVSVHVSSLLRKTGAGSRTELALWVLRAA